jgi:hypothetical protein
MKSARPIVKVLGIDGPSDDKNYKLQSDEGPVK